MEPLYLFLFILYFILAIRDMGDNPEVHILKQRSVSNTFIRMLPLMLIVAFRNVNVGNDTETYLRMYEYIQYESSFASAMLHSRLEPGYLLVSYYLGKWGYSYFVLQVLETIFIFYSWSKFFTRYSNRIYVSIFFFTVTIWLATANVVRMHLAIAILLFSIPYIQRRKPLIFALYILAAMSFHSSALIFAVMYPISTIRYSKKLTITILLSAIAIAYIGASFFETLTDTIGMYENYTEGKYFDDNRSLTAVILGLGVQTIVMVFLWLRGVLEPIQYEDALDGNGRKQILINYFCLMAFWINYALSIIGLTNNIMNRISAYFSICLMLLLPLALEKSNTREGRYTSFIMVGGAYLLQKIVIMILRPEWNLVVPYDTFFNF